MQCFYKHYMNKYIYHESVCICIFVFTKTASEFHNFLVLT